MSTPRPAKILGTMVLDVVKVLFAPFAVLGALLLLVLMSPILWYLNAERRVK